MIMKMRFSARLAAATAAVLLFLSGCGEPVAPDPPLAQTELMVRLLAALQARRIEEALQLTEKLQALDPDNIDLAELHNRLIGNFYARKCSELLTNRGVDAALAEVRRGRKQYAMHLRLRSIEQQLVELKKLANAAAALRKAGNEQTLAAALTAITPLVKDLSDAEQLKADIAARRKDLMVMRQEARKKAEEEARKKAEEEARKIAEEAARQKAAEEARRRAEEDAARLRTEPAGPLPAPADAEPSPAAAVQPSGGTAL